MRSTATVVVGRPPVKPMLCLRSALGRETELRDFSVTVVYIPDDLHPAQIRAALVELA